MNIIDYLIVIAKYKSVLIKNVLIWTFIGLVISFVITKEFKSTAEIIPVSSEGGGISSLLAGYSLNVLGKDIIIPEAYRAILGSQSLKDSLIKTFQLEDIYDEEYKEFLYKKIDEKIEIEIDKESGLGYVPIVAIRIHVLDELPERAQNMANYCLRFLEKRVEFLNKSFLEQKFLYIEKRYIQSINDIQIAENNLESFQKRFGILELSEQVKAIVTIVAELEARRELLKIEKNVLFNQTGAKSPLYKKLNSEINAINIEVKELYSSNGSNKVNSILKPLNDIPGLAKRYLNLYREIEIQNKIFEMVAIQYEQSKMQVDKDIPSILILNEAQLPTYKERPKKSLIVLAFFLLSLVVSLTYIVLIDFYYKNKSNKTDNYYKLVELRSNLKRKKNK
ncbi:MAG: hypothetical protein D8M58_00180 [Calditrichaeota bacterium]|nr:MAG: hypothetical protein DWQ03_06900 [Calditrichota bacterium]MBL1203786.1 hypothetical protein [Calditrichota bacterium]NOG43616.1 hypothetical protein [Calditrichota bacterium]